MCGAKNRRHIGRSKDAFQKLIKALWDRKFSFCYVVSETSLWLWMLDNFFTIDEDEAWSDRDVVLGTKSESIRDWLDMERRHFKEISNKKTLNEKKTFIISRMHNEEGQFREFNSHRAYWMEEDQREKSDNVSNDLME